MQPYLCEVNFNKKTQPKPKTTTTKSSSEPNLKVHVKLSLKMGKLYGWRSAPELLCQLRSAGGTSSSLSVSSQPVITNKPHKGKFEKNHTTL